MPHQGPAVVCAAVGVHTHHKAQEGPGLSPLTLRGQGRAVEQPPLWLYRLFLKVIGRTWRERKCCLTSGVCHYK